MSRFHVLLQNNNTVTLEQESPSQWHEGAYELRLLAKSADYFEDFFVFQFKYPLRFNSVEREPDMIFISKDFKMWHIVEVEDGVKRITRHTMSQLQVFAYGGFVMTRSDLASKIFKCLSDMGVSVRKSKINNLVNNVRWNVTAIFSQQLSYRDYRRCHDLGANYVLSIDIYKSDQERGHRVWGDFPLYPEKEGYNVVKDSMGNYLEVTSNPQPNLKLSQKLSVLYRCELTYWTVDKLSNGSIFLLPERRRVLDNSSSNMRLIKLTGSMYKLYELT